ncbi:MAG TPA: PAS domain S-box protein, partial [Propionibacteriaceae bacterium]
MTHSAEAMSEWDSTLYRQIVEAAHEGIWIHDLAGVTTFANAQMAELVGYSLAEMCSVTVFDLLDEHGRQQAREMLERERRSPLTEQVDCRYLRKDGSPVWCLVNRSPLLDGDGRHIGSINLVSDITERTRVDERLRHSGDLLEEAQRVGHLGSWSWEIQEDKLEWTDELYRILGITRSGADLTYQGYLDQVHPEDRDAMNTLVLGCLAGQPQFSYEGRIVRPDGQLVWIHAQGRRIVDSTGVLRSLRGTVLDITAYKTAQEQAQHTSSRYRLLQRMASAANSDMVFEQVLQMAVDEILLHATWPVGRGFLARGDPPELVLATTPPPRLPGAR